MTLIITHQGEKAEKVDPSSFPKEDSLQEYIFNNPESIPIYDIRDDIKLLILAREFSTSAGSIDAIGIDNIGDIYIIETKLYKNPDKRLVVAQVLDYGAALWHSVRDANQFITQIDQYLEKQKQPHLAERIQNYFGLPEEDKNQLIEQLKRNFIDGNYKYVVLMDELHEQLKNLILYINQNSEFDLYAVELKYYKHKTFEIVIPRLFGSEVKKDLTQKNKPSIPSDNDFLEAHQSSGQLDAVRNFLNIFNDIREERLSIKGVSAYKTPKFLVINVDSKMGKTSVQLGINPTYEGGGIQIWSDKNVWQNAKEIIEKTIPNAQLQKDIGDKTGGKLAKWPLKYFSAITLQDLLNRLISN